MTKTGETPQVRVLLRICNNVRSWVAIRLTCPGWATESGKTSELAKIGDIREWKKVEIVVMIHLSGQRWATKCGEKYAKVVKSQCCQRNHFSHLSLTT